MTTETVAATETLFGVLGFAPWPEQWPILRCKKRFMLLTGGEQGGKSLLASKVLMDRWTEDMDKFPGYGDGNGPPLLYWLIGAAYGETIKEFDYISDDLLALGQPVHATKRVDPGSIEVKFPKERKPRLRIETKSATDIRRLSKDAPHGIIICEPGQVDVIVFERAQGRLTPHNGWLFMPGTLETDSGGWFRQLGEAWASGADDRKSFMLPSYANRTLYPGGRDDPKILELQRHASDDFFMERIEGKAVPPKGVVFHEFRADLHVKDVEYHPGETVYIWEDPGYGSQHTHAVEIAHVIDGQVQVFDEIYERNRITEEIITICTKRPWWREIDTNNIVLVSDPSYKTQHHSMTSVEEQWLKQTGLVAGGTKIRINEGSERLKGFLKPDPTSRQPGIVFSPKCKGILSEFGANPSPFDGQLRVYRWKTDSEGNIFGDTPDDKYNDGLKAVIYGIVAEFGYGHVGSKKLKVTYW